MEDDEATKTQEVSESERKWKKLVWIKDDKRRGFEEDKK